MEPGEGPEQAARRELAEEVGLRRLTLRADLGCTEHGFEREGKHFRNRIHWFLYQVGPRAEMRLDPEEEVLDCGWFTPEQALSLLTHDDQRRLLRRALAGVTASEEGGQSASDPDPRQ
jgi:8-oxo-dGTP pyrophosphatase MutT (NUDIX family)